MFAEMELKDLKRLEGTSGFSDQKCMRYSFNFLKTLLL